MVGEWVAGGVAVAALKVVLIDVGVEELSRISEVEVHGSTFLAAV